MAENLKKAPKKGILKHHEQHSNSYDSDEGQPPAKHFHFDEMNIIATFHPEGKEYGHMPINEPKTPFHEGASVPVEAAASSGDGDEANTSVVDEEKETGAAADDLAARLVEMQEEEAADEHKDKEVIVCGSEAIHSPNPADEHHKEFEEKRKKHYDEGLMLKKARELVKQDLEALGETDDVAPSSTVA